MPVTINGTTGVVTPGATSGSINGILKSSSGVVSQASVGTDYSQLILETAQAASGTAVDFTGIPSWVKRITVMLNEVSFSGTSAPLIRLGTSSGIVSTGYNSDSSGSTATGNTLFSSTVGHALLNPSANGFSYIGSIVFNNVSSNIWIGNGMTYYGAAGGTISVHTSVVNIGSTLDRLRITTTNGTDTFDAGTINISFEG
jgi:hypothetical protein